MRGVIRGVLALFCCNAGVCQETTPAYLDIGPLTGLAEIYVDPRTGDDSNSGASGDAPLKTLAAAWNSIPQGTELRAGVRINLAPGAHPESSIPNYFESRYGTADAPIIIQSAGAIGSAVLQGDINMYDSRRVYIIGVTVRPEPAGDAFHCERCDHILLRGSIFDGGRRSAHETIKFNQSSHIYLENNNIHGADDNAVDFVAVNAGHLIGNAIHDAQDWCAYVKGGSAQITLANNTFFNCGTGGFTAGQGTGFEFMTSPWLHYEAYDIKFFNNIVHDTAGAGVGVNGGFNVLIAHNTLYRVGSRSHALEVVFGSRSCDGDTAACLARRAAGGWGSPSGEEPIPNRHVFIANNIVFNPPGVRSADQHLAIYPPRAPSPESNIPSPARTDDDLVIRGNIFWNGPSDLPLGIDRAGGVCADSNPVCSEAQLRSENSFNTIEPIFLDPAAGDFRPAPGSSILSHPGALLASFTNEGRPTTPAVPAGRLDNTLPLDRGGLPRETPAPPGAYASPDSPRTAPPPDSSIPETPDDSTTQHPPRVSIRAITLSPRGAGLRIGVRASVVDFDGVVARVAAVVKRRGVTRTRFRLAEAGAGLYAGGRRTPRFSGRFTVTVTATDDQGASRSRSRRGRAR